MKSVRRSVIATAAAVTLGATGLAGCHSKSASAPRTTHGASTTTATLITTPGGDVYEHTRAGDLSPTVAAITPKVYVPNSLSNTVDVIDPKTFRVIDHFAVGALPQHVTPSYDLKTLYVDNDEGNTLTPIDAATGRPGTPISVADPYNLYFTPGGKYAVVVAERLHRLDFRDPKTWKVVGSVHIPYAGVDHADFSVDDTTMIASCEFSGWIVRVDLERRKLTGALHVGGQPIDVKLAPDGKTFYVANQSRNGVSVINAKSFKETSFIPTGAGAHGLFASRDGQSLYVSNRSAGTITVLDFKSGKFQATWHVGGSPDMGGVSTDGTQLWVSSRYHGEVLVIDTTVGRVIATIHVGNGPHGLSLFPQPGRFSLGHTGLYR